MQRDYAAEYRRRQERARRQGFRSYGQRRYVQTVRHHTADSQWAKDLAEQCCRGRHETGRAGSLLCRHCNDVVNPRDVSRESYWQARLYAAAQASEGARSDAARRGWETRRARGGATRRQPTRRRPAARPQAQEQGPGVLEVLSDALGDALELLEEGGEL